MIFVLSGSGTAIAVGAVLLRGRPDWSLADERALMSGLKRLLLVVAKGGIVVLVAVIIALMARNN